jgi:HTH-type transcriptional regulator / antitoxin HigA
MSTTTEYRELVNEYLPRPIRNEADYRRTLRQFERLMVPHPNAARSMLIEVLATLVEQYESQERPLPDVPPSKMLAHCIEARETTAAQVSKDTGIAHATISNVLAGRRGISKASALKLAQYFHIPVSVFLETE